jgi:hypothetical protein
MANAYSQAPWRKQLQVVVGFLLILVALALIASVYLYVSSQAVAAGVAVQRMNRDITTLRMQIEDYESELAALTSEKVMAERARALGFEPVDPEKLLYLRVDAYTGRPGIEFASPPPPASDSTLSLSPAYSESLLEWVTKNLLTPSEYITEIGQ